MKVRATVTAELRPTRKGNGQMQVLGLHTGGVFPLEDTVYIPNEEKPLAPGEYIVNGRLVRKGYDKVYDYNLRDLVAQK
jgi:hypothetical protein